MHKILWPDQFLVSSRSDLGGLLCDPVEELSSRRRLAPVEAEDEFVEVILEVLVPDGSLVCSEHPPLEQGNRSVDSWKHMLPVLETTLDLPVMDVSFYLTVGVEPVSANGPPGFHRGSDEAMKRCPVEIGDSCHADATDAFAVLLGCDDDQHLAVDQAAGCSPDSVAPQ